MEEQERRLPEVAEIGLIRFKNSIRTPSLQILNSLIEIQGAILGSGEINVNEYTRRVGEITEHYTPFIKKKKSEESS